MLLQLPLGIDPRVPVVPLPPPLGALLAGQVPAINQTLQRTLDATDRHLKTFLPLQLSSKVLGGDTGPRTTVRVKVTALGLLTEDNGNPPKDTRKKQRVEGVRQWRRASRHEKVTRRTAGSEGLTVGTRLATKVQQ